MAETEYEKDFDGWNKVKTTLNKKNNIPVIQQREIWWCAIGINIGNEEDGKGKTYSRPVLIVRKFSPSVFLGIPLTTQIKDRWHYHRIHLHGQEQCVILQQLRLFDTKRLTTKLGKLSKNQFNAIRAVLKNMI